MKTILQGWNLMRAVRLALALAILVQGINNRNTGTINLAIGFGGMAIANIGCCGTGGCGVSPRFNNKKIEDVEYEEVVSSK